MAREGFIARSQYSPEHTLFRQLLREARLRAGLTQTQLGDHLGIHQLLISRGEMGDRKTDIIELYEMCEAMGISFAEFTRELGEALSALKQSQAKLKKTQHTLPQNLEFPPNYACQTA